MASVKTQPRRRIEQRIFPLTQCEIRADEASGANVFVGYAAMFGTLSVNLGGFRERIHQGAFRNSLDRGDDVRFLINHDKNQVLGRSTAGTITLTEDEIGLRVECVLPATSFANDLAISMERGDINQMSFGFYTDADDWKVKDSETNLPIRELLEATLFDVSVVTFPAYPDTMASVRDMIAEEQPQLLERAAEAAEEIEFTEAELLDGLAETLDNDEERVGKSISASNAEKIANAAKILQDLLDSANPEGETTGSDGEGVPQGANDNEPDGEEREEDETPEFPGAADLREKIAEVLAELEAARADERPDMKGFRELLEERGWNWEDDWMVWSLTNMIESASCLLVCANDDDDATESEIAGEIGEIMQRLIALLGMVATEAAARDEDPNDENEDDGAAELEMKRRRLQLLEHEISLV